jgi:hypothetical protein
VILAGVGLWFWNYTQTKSLKLDLRVQPSDKLTAPEYLYSFGGTKANHLTAPVGVLADGGNVYVADSTGSQLFLFKENGRFVKTFGKGKVVDPLYIAKSPKDGLLYVTDRGKHALLKFTTAGEYVGEFDPKLPKDQLPTFKATSEWIPIALAFLLLACFFRSMRYELDARRLTLRYGPLLTYRIPLDEIRSIRRRNLGMTIWSSIRFPGIALYTIPYADVGNVKMCATSALDKILLIETGKTKYGLTPADEETFIAALRAQMES